MSENDAGADIEIPESLHPENTHRNIPEEE